MENDEENERQPDQDGHQTIENPLGPQGFCLFRRGVVHVEWEQGIKDPPSMQYWLVKQEPDSYAWTDFVRDKKTSWEGVRNFQARNNLRAMKKGDAVLFYESMTTKAVVGIAEVSKEAFPDPTADEGDWSTVELKAVRALPAPVTLSALKAEKSLADLKLIRQSQLSVMPVSKSEYSTILRLAAG